MIQIWQNSEDKHGQDTLIKDFKELCSLFHIVHFVRPQNITICFPNFTPYLTQNVILPPCSN